MRAPPSKPLPIWAAAAAAAATASSNRAILVFSNSGDLPSARRIFSQISHPDVVSWNSIMSAYARHGSHGEVLRLFKQMQSAAMAPSHTTLATVFSSCAELRALEEGRQLHCLSIKRRSSGDAYVGTSLLTMYSKCSLPDCSVRAFEDVDGKNTECRNALLSAMIRDRQVFKARRIFDQMPERNTVSWTAMIGGLVQDGRIEEALELFHSAPSRNGVTCSVMLRGLVSDGRLRDSIRLFKVIAEEEGRRSCAAVIVPVVAACSGLADGGDCGRAVHGHILRLGFDADPTIEASLISMYFSFSEVEVRRFGRGSSVEACNSMIRGYCDSSRLDEARRIFDGMMERDGSSWFLMIRGYLKHNLIDSAVDLFSAMPNPAVEVCTVLASALIEAGRMGDARDLYDQMPERDVILSTAMVSGYMSKGLPEEAMELFRTIPHPGVITVNVVLSGLILHGRLNEARDLFSRSPLKDEVSWSTMISGLVRGGFGGEAVPLLKKMMRCSHGVRPNEPAIAGVLGALASLSALAPAESIHGLAVKLGFERRLLTANSLTSMYSKCGEVRPARSVFDRTQNRDLVSWNSMLHGYAVNGHGSECFDLFEKMKSSGMEPDDITFLAVLSACVHGRLLEEAKHHLHEMRSEHGMNPSLAHYSCLIELLCRLGRMKEAEELVHSMPFEPDSAIWSSLLGGAALNLQADLAEYAADRLLAIEPRDSTPYLALTRIYAATGQSANLQKLRKRRKAGRMNTRPGRSWIEIDGKIVSFFAGDKSLLPSGEAIVQLEEGLIPRIKEIGYAPDYNRMREEMEEQEEPTDLWRMPSGDEADLPE